MIPKVIHFCWFGGNPKPEKIKNCIESWKRVMPEYDVIEWNESNFDIECNMYVKQAYDAKMWAFVADYFRFWVLKRYGGIYFDSDVEAIKPFDDFLHYDFFTCYESEYSLEAAVIGSIKDHSIVTAMCELFETKMFIVDGKKDKIPLPIPFTEHVRNNYDFKFDYKSIALINENIAIFPKAYFSPMDFTTFKIKNSKDTHAIHRFSNSWRDAKELDELSKQRKYQKIFGRRLGRKFYYFNWSVRCNGFFRTLGKALKHPFKKRKRQ